ncbi:MAG: hypothetical protein JWM41_2989 [Gemmatimonadetes bacterium]|nr:hypothetical protein [Gemmatimonadota bacterium]
MPKLIVLFHGDDQAAASLAESAAAGAKAVRFTEVDIRSATATGGPPKRIESAAQLREYDGVLLAYAGDEAPAEARATLAELANGEPMPNTVFGVTGVDAAALQAVAQLGGIIVSQPRGADGNESARQLGARMAKVIGWVRHALGHEAEHTH